VITKVRIALRLFIFDLFILGINVCPLEIPAQTAETLAPEASSKETLAVSQGEAKIIDDINGKFNSFLGAYAKSAVTDLPRSTTIGRGLGQGRGIVTGVGRSVGSFNGITTALGRSSGVYGRSAGGAGRGRGDQKQ